MKAWMKFQSSSVSYSITGRRNRKLRRVAYKKNCNTTSVYVYKKVIIFNFLLFRVNIKPVAYLYIYIIPHRPSFCSIKQFISFIHTYIHTYIHLRITYIGEDPRALLFVRHIYIYILMRGCAAGNTVIYIIIHTGYLFSPLSILDSAHLGFVP